MAFLGLWAQTFFAQTTWMGNTNADWHTASNWSAGVPDGLDDVTISSAAHDPVISAPASAKSLFVSSSGKLVLNAGGFLSINSNKSYGNMSAALYNAGTIENSGTIHLGQTASADLGHIGLWNLGMFTNNAEGLIVLDRSNHTGLRNELGVFHNYGKITIGAAFYVGFYGLINYAIFENRVGGEITIQSASYAGMLNTGQAGSVFANLGKITIGEPSPWGMQHGLINSQDGYFDNDSGAELNIDGISGPNSIGLHIVGGDVANLGKINIGATGGGGELAIRNEAALLNDHCGVLLMNDPLYNDGPATNKGLWVVSTAQAHVNNHTFHNYGILSYPQGNPIPNVTNHDVIAKPISGNCGPIANALQVSLGTHFNIGAFWYKDPGLTQLGGSYDPATNTLTPNSTSSPLFVVIKDKTYGCARVVAVPLNITDVTPPSISCPLNATANAPNGQCQANVSYPSPTASDNCGNASVALVSPSLPSGSVFSVGVHNVTWEATDEAGLTKRCTFTVTVSGTNNLSITCPPNQTQNCDANQCGATIMYPTPTATDYCGGAPSVVWVSGGSQPVPNGNSQTAFFQKGNTTVTWKATGAANATATCTFDVAVSDAKAPDIVCPQNLSTNAPQGQCHAVVNYALPTATDNCPGVAVALVPPSLASGAQFGIGLHSVTWEAVDAVGLTQRCTFTVTVNGAQGGLSISCPPGQTKNCDANQCGAAVTYPTPTATDYCGGTPSVAWVSGGSQPVPNGNSQTAFFQKGNTTVTWKATGAANTTVTCTFNVAVNDAQAPSISCPANQTKSTDANACTAAVTYTTPTAADNCTMPNGQPLWQSGGTAPAPSGPNSISTFQKGQTTVTWKATDGAGLTKTCTFRVTVNDTQAPTFTLCPGSQSLNTDAGQCSAVATYTTPTASDNCTPPPTVVKTSGLASGSAFPKGTNTVVWKAIDGAGLTKTCSFTVTVTDAQLPSINCLMNISATGTGSPCTAMVTYATPTATDNCGINSLFLLSGLASGSSFPAGVTTNVWRAVDNSGGSATCVFTVTVGCGTSPSLPPRWGGDVAAERDVVRDVVAPPHRGGWEGPYLRLAPNPATTEVQISMEHFGSEPLTSGGELLLFDAMGRMVLRQAVAVGQESVLLDLSSAGLPSGSYQVSWRTERGVVTKGLIVNRL